MSTRKHKLKKEEIRRAFAEKATDRAILSPEQFGGLIGVSLKTIYEWLGKGRLDGAFRKRGKHILLWRDRAVEILFNGEEWNND